MLDTEKLLLLCTLFISSAYASTVKTFELENIIGGPGFPRTHWRSGASKSSSLRVFQGDKVIINLCLLEPTTVSVSGLQYSNDGGSDQIDFWVNNVFVGYVTTLVNADVLGNNWNQFRPNGPVGIGVKLSAGKHTLVIAVDKSDCYGVELDSINMAVDTDVVDELFWCDSQLLYAPDPTKCASELDSRRLSHIFLPQESLRSEMQQSKITDSVTTSLPPSTENTAAYLVTPTSGSARGTSVSLLPASSRNPAQGTEAAEGDIIFSGPHMVDIFGSVKLVDANNSNTSL